MSRLAVAWKAATRMEAGAASRIKLGLARRAIGWADLTDWSVEKAEVIDDVLEGIRFVDAEAATQACRSMVGRIKDAIAFASFYGRRNLSCFDVKVEEGSMGEVVEDELAHSEMSRTRDEDDSETWKWD